MSIQNLFRKNIRTLRDSLNLTQAEMAHRMGMDPASYNRWESGKVWPPPEKVDRLAKSLSVETWELYADHDKIKKPLPIPPTISELARELTLANDRIKELEAQLSTINQGKVVETTYPELSRVLEYPELLNEVLNLIQDYEAGLPAQLKPKTSE